MQPHSDAICFVFLITHLALLKALTFIWTDFIVQSTMFWSLCSKLVWTFVESTLVKVTTVNVVYLWETASKTSLHCLMIFPFARSMIFVWKILIASWYKSYEVFMLVRSSETFLSRASRMTCIIIMEWCYKNLKRRLYVLWDESELIFICESWLIQKKEISEVRSFLIDI